MIKHFLEYVAEDLLRRFGTDMSHIAVVFPNKRASLFLNQYLFQLVHGEPIWAPSYLTISELFRRHSALTVADPIKQVCDLHKTYVECTGASESIDHFYSWGQLMLTDFDDVDKNMADAEKVFRDINDLAEIDKDLSYLTPEQRAVLRKFFANFTDEPFSSDDATAARHADSELKKRFLGLWQHFTAIYRNFNQRLTKQGLAYEGALYRSVADDETASFDEYDTYVFIGFNLLQKVEQRLFKRLKDEGKALFYWDFDDYYMPHDGIQDNEAGHFIAQYIRMFPNALDVTDATIYKNFKRKPRITIANASTDTVQAAYMSHWLSENAPDETDTAELAEDTASGENGGKPFRIKAGRDTAIVMCDENLLQTVMHSVPDTVDKANITTGFPLQQTAISSFVSQLITLQSISMRSQSDRYRLHDVLKVLRHPYSAIISPNTADLVATLTKEGEKVFFPSREQLAIDAGLRLLFTDIAKEAASTHKDLNLCLFAWLQAVLKQIGVSSDNDDALFTESVFRMYTIVSRLITLMESGDLRCDLHTLQRLFSQLIGSTSIPFHGEPIEGIQIMGVLETRNLDFTHLLLLSCNEGNMPKGVNDASFIPYSVRKAYGLTTVDHKVAIYAYYFYRMLQRSTDVTILSSSVKDTGTPSERSRFITQLIVESGIPVKHASLNAQHKSLAVQGKTPVAKTKDIMDALHDIGYLSPTAINRYLKCPLTFYYKNIAHINEYDDDEQVEIDNRTFGLVFHSAAENMYKEIAPDGHVAAAAIDAFLKSRHSIERVVDEAFAQELFKERSSKFRPEYNGLQLINRAVINSYIRSLLELDRKKAPFTICGEELFVSTDFTIPGKGTIKIGGTIDRLDIVTDKETGRQTVRVVDYKTGVYRKQQNNQLIKSVDEIFLTGDEQKPHSDYYLQTMLYSLIVSKSAQHNPNALPVSPSLLYIQHAHDTEYDPVIQIGDNRITDIEKHRTDFEKNIASVIAEIYDSGTGFYPTTSERLCKNCPYKVICNM